MEETESVLEEERFYCFADFEFTCGERIHRNQAEMLSVGIVICDSEFEIEETYYNTACPVRNPSLTSRCRKLTGLSQDEIYCSPDSNSVLEQVADLLEDYGIDEICVWGNYDHSGLLSDARQHSKAFLGCDNIEETAEMITDIQPEIVKKLGLPEAVNIEELAGAFGFSPEEGSFHNAFNDAMGLYVIAKGAFTTEISENTALRQIIDDRCAKRTARREEIRRQRDEIANVLPLEAEEQAFLSGLGGGDGELIRERFTAMRYTIMKKFIALPECGSFMLICFGQPRRIKVLPIEKYSAEKACAAVFAREITREDFAGALIKAADAPADEAVCE